jgi:hypothetical protein
MDPLQITSTTNNPLGILFVETVNKLLAETSSPSNVAISTFTDDFVINVAERVVLGSSFTPAITTKPSIVTALEYDVAGKGYLLYIIDRVEPNVDGIHWDVVVTPLEDNIDNVTINVI